MKSKTFLKRLLALTLVFSMVIGMTAYIKSDAAPEAEQLILSDKEEYTRAELELILDLLGDGESAEGKTDEELKELVDKIISSNTDKGSSTVTNLSTNTTTKKENPYIDSTGKEEFYGVDGEIKVPFDEIYPELIENEQVEFSGESILLKLSSDRLTNNLKDAGIASLEVIVPLEENAWYEAKLKKGTDAKAAIENVRELKEVILAEYNYELQVAAIDDYKHFDKDKDEEFKKNGHNKDQWHFHYCGIPDGYEEMDNEGGLPTTIVAVIDTGVDYDHEDLKDNIWVNKGEIPDNGRDDDGNGYVDDYYGVDIVAGKGSADDDNGHGTHVAGIIAARNNNTGVVGIAYNTKIMPIKAAMHNGTLNQADIARAVLYAYEMGAEVINMSFGGTGCTIAVQDALAVAYTRCVLVASAGNSGKPNEVSKTNIAPLPNYPAALSYVLGVMSVDENGVESAFTNWDVNAFNGIEYELYAPGENIMSTLPNDEYGYLSGTSMAAPMVSAMAAILRGEFADRDMYPTKFIYGQLASTSDYYGECIDPMGHGLHSLPQIVNLEAALTKLPKPEVNLQDFAIFDSVELSDKNNGDGVIDAGETIALGLTLRNRWGMSENTIVTIDTLENGISDPYVNIVKGEINYGSVGTYSTQDCGKIMTDGLLTGWEDPFIVKIADDCPNDYRMTFHVTIKCENALDEEDEAVYTSDGDIDLTARNGVILPSVIDEDMVLTKDNLYIIPNATVINKGATVRVEPGTHIQFWSDDAKDPYASDYIAYLLVNGKFLVEGTKEEPVYIYPSQLMDYFGVEIGSSSTGYVSLKYADITNFGYCNYDHTGTGNNIDSADHCTFRINYGDAFYYRYVSGGNVHTSGANGFRIGRINATNCVFYKVGNVYDASELNGSVDRCIFVDCAIELVATAQNCVFLGNCFTDQRYPDYSKPTTKDMYAYSAEILQTWYREETGTTYVYAEGFPDHDLLREKYGLNYAVIETEDEWRWLRANSGTEGSYFAVGIYHNGEKFVWSDGTEIATFIDPDGIANRDKSDNYYPVIRPRHDATLIWANSSRELYEIPGHILPTEITFDEYSVNIDTGATYQLAPHNTPIQLPLDAFIYESTDESVVKVSETGLVTPVGQGSADVYVYSLDRAVKNYVTFNVVDYVPLEGISFAEEQLLIAKGEVANVKCILTPADTTRKNVTYSSDNAAVATVDAAGNITACGKGTANITATCEGMTATLSVKVYVKTTFLEFEDEVYYGSLEDGTMELPKVICDEGAEPKLSWRSTDEAVATVENGKLNLLSLGTTTIVVKEEDIGLSAEFTLIVLGGYENKAVKDIQTTQKGVHFVLFEDGSLYAWENGIPTCVLTGVKFFSCGYYNRDYLAVAFESGAVEYYYLEGTELSHGYTYEFEVIKDAVDFEYNGYSNHKFFVLTDNGSVYAWGRHESGELGTGNIVSVTEPTLVNLDGVVDVESGGYSTWFLTANGELYATGRCVNSHIPVLVDKNVARILYVPYTWSEYCYYRTDDGTVKYHDNNNNIYTYAGHREADDISFVAYNGSHFLQIRDGKVYSYYGSLGDGFNNWKLVPGITNAKKVYGGHFIVTEDDQLYTLDAVSLGIYEENTDKAVLVPFSEEKLPGEIVTLTDDGLTDGTLTENELNIGLSKKLKVVNPKLYADGAQIPVRFEIVDVNYVNVSRLMGFEEGVEYELVFEANTIKGSGSITNSEEIRIAFTYVKAEEAPAEPEETPEETPEEVPEVVPEIVIHESVLDTTVERILTVEKLQAELDALQAEYQFNDQFYGNAILNPFSTVTDVTKWFRPIAGTVSAGQYVEIGMGGNYWGTDNKRAIELQMVDYTDFITYGRLMYEPFMTAAPENTFPFVTSVKLFNEYGEEVTTVGNEKITFRITFNRDMDTSIPLLVRFGSAYPYGDYEIAGEYVDARTWEGTYTLNTLIENGNQYFTISNGCSATEDLELQPDRMRFGFVIDTTAAQALIMQGTATDTGIELKWTQDDFDTLMGYNVYRSDKEDGYYTRLNSTVIPADTMEFFDSTVEPGKVYYYNFTVVKTDLTESEPSGKISIMSKDTMAPDIYHSPVVNAFTGSNLVISATVTDNLNIAYANIYYRAVGESQWKIIRMNSLNDKYSAIILASDVTMAGIEYYIEAFDGVSFTYKGSEDAPFVIAVQEAVSANALGDVDGDGSITNFDALKLLYAINDKYNMKAEEFARADLNGDGELWAAEALRILQYVSGVVGSVKM